jgi:hypothetical protein
VTDGKPATTQTHNDSETQGSQLTQLSDRHPGHHECCRRRGPLRAALRVHKRSGRRGVLPPKHIHGLVAHHPVLFHPVIGDPTNKPTIKGLPTFQGIALIDTDVYIPGGNGSQWYINQNQFFRQIRNFIIDLTAMPNENTSGDQTYVPTGIHWQVAQATSLQNIDFVMPLGGGTTAVGIFTENGSGGFMSDLTFFGGNIAMRVGSQQFTARHITMTLPATAVSMTWNWGWTWQDITVDTAFVAFDCTNFGGDGRQGTGSLTVLDSRFISVPFAIPVTRDRAPAITLDNLRVEGNTPSVVLVSGGETILAGVSGGSATIRSWAMGPRYTSTDGSGSNATGPIDPPPDKPAVLLDGGGSGRFLHAVQAAVRDARGRVVRERGRLGATGDGTGDQSGAINSALAELGLVEGGRVAVGASDGDEFEGAGRGVSLDAD